MFELITEKEFTNVICLCIITTAAVTIPFVVLILMMMIIIIVILISIIIMNEFFKKLHSTQLAAASKFPTKVSWIRVVFKGYPRCTRIVVVWSYTVVPVLPHVASISVSILCICSIISASNCNCTCTSTNNRIPNRSNPPLNKINSTIKTIHRLHSTHTSTQFLLILPPPICMLILWIGIIPPPFQPNSILDFITCIPLRTQPVLKLSNSFFGHGSV
mmetsp:Transcript_7115/g.10846  ORF Transcript_7115/g.10846 Transcript_7115/m.10846 type:complete len:217 (-) Transcript_7115:969-1619(-)